MARNRQSLQQCILAQTGSSIHSPCSTYTGCAQTVFNSGLIHVILCHAAGRVAAVDTFANSCWSGSQTENTVPRFLSFASEQVRNMIRPPCFVTSWLVIHSPSPVPLCPLVV